jgi:hypothetical protein
MRTFFLAWFLPSLPALVLGAQLTIAHFKTAGEKQEIQRQLQDVWDRGVEDPSAVTKGDCRQIQDCIFAFRAKAPPVPDRVYHFLRSHYEIDMRSGANDLKEQAVRVLGLQV